MVEDGAEIGDGTKIWHHAHVMSGARIGKDCVLGKDVFVSGGAVVGDRVRIQNGVSVYDGVKLGDAVFVGPHAVFTNVENPRAFVDRRKELAETNIGEGATVGAGAVIVCGHSIGSFAFVAAGAVVTHDVPPHALVAGNPARRIGWVSRVGRRLPEGDGVVACPETGEEYLVDAHGCTPLPGEPAVALQSLAAETAFFAPRLRAAFERVLASAQFVLGEEVRNFETRAASYLGIQYTIAVSSGSDALLMALMSLGIGPGDEVVTTPLSFFATVEAIVRLGASPVFVDVDRDTNNLDPALVEQSITPRTRAILPVHLFGLPASPKLFDIAAERGIPVVEDAAQCFGARTPRGAAGALGTIGCFSFFPTKNLGALGDAGMVCTANPDLAARLRALREHGASPKYNHVMVGGNFRMDALQAAFLTEKLPQLDSLTARRVANAAAYRSGLEELERRGYLALPPGSPSHVYHHFVVRTQQRDALALHLNQRRIGTGVYYPIPLHSMPVWSSSTKPWRPSSYPVSEEACKMNLALPIHPWLTPAAIERVIDAVGSYFQSG